MAQVTVQSGDTLSRIAQNAGIQLPKLLELNPQFQANPNLILPGQNVNLPDIGVSQPPTQQQQLGGIQQGIQGAQQQVQNIQGQVSQLPPPTPANVSVTSPPTQTGATVPGATTELEQLFQFLNPPETQQQIQFREQQQGTLDRLVNLQQQLSEAGQPSEELQGIQNAITQQQRVLQDLTPGGLLQTQPGLQEEGITQAALQRSVAAKRDPIARGLSELLFSESLLSQQEQRRTQQLQAQAQFAGQEFELRGAIQGLQPQPFDLPQGIQSDIIRRQLFPESKEQLSVAEAKSLGVPFGTTREEAEGITPITKGPTISISEANILGLPTSIVGRTEQDILGDLASPTPPQWFTEGLPLVLSQGGIKSEWDKFRNKINSQSGRGGGFGFDDF